MENYNCYNPDDIRILLEEPWEISDQPYKLHAAFALSCLYETVVPMDDDEEDPFTPNDMWGCTVPQKILERLVLDIQDSFNDAAKNYKQVDIWGKSYSIRKVNAYDRKRLYQIFNFPLKDGEYTITKDGIMNLRGITPDILKKYELSREELNANRLYLRQIIMLAEDDAHNGWDKLTDMEIVMYCWALYYNKYQFENVIDFKQKYKDYIYVESSAIESCLIDKAQLSSRPHGMYTFSAAKVKEWNDKAKQTSYASSISQEDADNYWYDVALKKTFVPIDRK